MEYKDYYAILGVDKKASQDAIKHAYRRLARKYHPDVSKEANAEDKFKDLQEAYEVLKDPEKRSVYDQLGSNWKAGQDFRPPPGYESSGRFHTSEGFAGFSDEDMSSFSDFFSHLFGGGRSQHADADIKFGRGGFAGLKQRGQDSHAIVRISLNDAFHGVTKTIQLQVPEEVAPGKHEYRVRTLKINIPVGASAGQQLRLAKQGGPGIGGGPAGDLYLEIEIEPHPFFSLQGQDIYLTLPVTPWEAALGADIKVPTLSGVVGLKLAANSQAGQKLRLKGKGMPGKPHVGDQYAILQILTPPVKTAEDRQFYEKMAAAMPFNPRANWPI